MKWRRGQGRGGTFGRDIPPNRTNPSPLPFLRRGREPPGHLTRFAALSPRPNTDPSPQPSPLRKGRGGTVGSSLANRGSGAGRRPRGQCANAPVTASFCDGQKERYCDAKGATRRTGRLGWRRCARCAEGNHRTRRDTPPEIPATELPLFHEMEERAGERRHVWVEAGAIVHQTGPPSPWPSPAPSSQEREKTSRAVSKCPRYSGGRISRAQPGASVVTISRHYGLRNGHRPGNPRPA